MAELTSVIEVNLRWIMEGFHLEVSDGADAQSFNEQRDLLDSRSDGGDIPRSMNPDASNHTLA